MVPLFLALAVSSVAAQTIGSRTQPVIVDQGPHHNLWQYQTYEPGPDGKPVAKIHQYRELASGLNYLNGGKWTASIEKIDVFPGGAVAQHGQTRIIFANDINTATAIDMQTSDGQRLRSHILGLMYSDSSTGKAVIIARLQDAEGELVADNQVLYPNAFEGVKADVRYNYRLEGNEQDVILREQPPTPEAYGMNSATTELEVITEFEDPPSQITAGMSGTGASDDQQIRWGGTSLGESKAFNLGGEPVETPVSKQFIQMDGRHFLLEKVSVQAIESALKKLPEQASNARRLSEMASVHVAFPKAPARKSTSQSMRLAIGAVPDKGYVLDYSTLSGNVTNFTFQGDSTYFISGPVNLYGTTTIRL